jgi:hypothetical protein
VIPMTADHCKARKKFCSKHVIMHVTTGLLSLHDLQTSVDGQNKTPYVVM